jgi:hypothetical protein
MKRIALVMALVVMAAGACKKAENRSAADSTADTTRMADSMKMAPGDTMHHMGDTTKARTDTTHRPSRRP